MGTELAKAYVQIIPTAEGIQGKLGEMLGGEADSAGKLSGAKFSGGFSGAAKAGLAGAAKVGLAAAKVGLAAVGAASTAVVKLGTDAVKAYAEYEQLAGGAELLFGSAYDFVAEKAAGAFASVQMSQTEYLQQVNGFATGLKTALGGDEMAAAQLADRILTAEADIVAATGTSQEAVQNAFNGIMKSNYSMLDNLQLGIAPTKAGMQEVIDKVNEWNAANGEASDYVIDNLADVQNALVDYIEMQGLAGYAAEEAAGTIQGSVSTLKASWENLVVGLATPDADISALIGNVVESAQTAFGNLLPVAEQALSGIGQLVTGMAPIISEALPMLVSDVLPSILTAATSFVETLGGALIENAPMIFETGVSLLLELVNGLSQSLPELIPSAIEAVLTIVDTLTQPDMISQLIDAALTLILALAEGLITALPELIAKAPEIVANLVTAIITNAPKLLSAALELVVTLAGGIISNLGEMAKAAGQIILTLLNGLNSLLSSFASIGLDIVRGIWNGISNGFSWITGKIRGWVGDVLSFFKNILGIASPSKVFAEMGGFLAQGIGVGIEDNIGSVTGAMKDLSDAAVGAWNADNLTASVAAAGAHRFGGAGADYGSRTNSVVVNVYGAAGQSVDELARKVERVITQSIQTKEAAWA